MATTPEGKVKKAIKDYLRSIGAWFYMPVQNGMGVVGIPDILACYRGFMVAIEVKAPGKCANTTANQKMRIAEINRAGGMAFVADSVETVKQYLATLDAAT